MKVCLQLMYLQMADLFPLVINIGVRNIEALPQA